MNIRPNKLSLIALAVTMPFLLSCLYLQRLIQVPEPKMEENVDTVLEVLSGGDWVSLQELTAEKYTGEEYAQPGTLTFTAKVTNDKPVYFNYGWCTKDEATLQQNFEHITVQIYFNGGKLGEDVVHPLAYTTADGQYCLDFGMLLSDWPAGEYKVKAAVNFDQNINDGWSDYDAGNYIYEYTITVEENAD
ncbi:MAG TPA: hypothetical protein VFR47_03180 [Anaerolineales bacterium]|nr:hypothetical protein [Anaerolineales bacterium]